MMGVIDLRVAASHPSLPGHFPENPLVPGVVILDLVAETILARHPDSRIGGFPQVKFLSLLAPETGFQLTWTERPDGQIDFYCDAGSRRLVEGRMQLKGIR
jgi:3-hydroxymyristoyl/3-hydroxydecanoyl-(acyl carrier protein) dehydratase